MAGCIVLCSGVNKNGAFERAFCSTDCAEKAGAFKYLRSEKRRKP
jgi:hypothetical protein